MVESKLQALIAQVRHWVSQTMRDSEERIKAFTHALVDERVRAMDAQVNAFEVRVQLRLEGTRPVDTSVVT